MVRSVPAEAAVAPTPSMPAAPATANPAGAAAASEAARHLAALKAENLEIKRQLAEAILAHDAARTISAEDLAAETAELKARLAFYRAGSKAARS